MQQRLYEPILQQLESQDIKLEDFYYYFHRLLFKKA